MFDFHLFHLSYSYINLYKLIKYCRLIISEDEKQQFAKVTKITAPLFLFFRNKILSFSLCQFYLLVFLNIKSKRII
ncbi:hypothetical protein COL63_13650 [Bacillus pseudomycoides]|nr:hypothetical protein COL63_13650 [Bacillus pseudomycoides]PHB16582.1 hypothetical protein COE85_21320 [Bacillus pseudomycoides]